MKLNSLIVNNLDIKNLQIALKVLDFSADSNYIFYLIFLKN
jgi:hypothetical protein